MNTKDNQEEKQIDYRYLNMDTKQFVTHEELISHVKEGGLHRAIPNYKCNQVLVAGGNEHFSEFDAIFLSRTISFGERFWVKK